jgi:hypothetical protein
MKANQLKGIEDYIKNKTSKENAEEDYNKTPISVLKYIGELEDTIATAIKPHKESEKER